MGKRIVIALGGNALGNNLPEQMAAVKHTAKAIVDLIQEGHQVVVAHGNGPQVGMINVAMTTLSREDKQHPIAPMSVCTAMSQGYIGYDLQNSLREELLDRGIRKPVATVLTQVEVDPDDPAFQNPSKPIGAFMTEAEAEEMRRRGNCVMDYTYIYWLAAVRGLPQAQAHHRDRHHPGPCWTRARWSSAARRRHPRVQHGGQPPQGRRRRHRQGLRLGAAGGAAGCGHPHHPHRGGEVAVNFGKPEPAVAGPPDAGGGKAVRGGGPIRPLFHAAQGPGGGEVRRVPSPAAPPSSPCWRSQDGIAGKTGTAVSR